MSDLGAFRERARDWLEANCPASMRGPGVVADSGTRFPIKDPYAQLWLDRCAEQGWTVPTWPVAYGGAALSTDEYIVLLDEMKRIKASSPLGGMGVGLIGPTLIEYGTEDQKTRHLPRIARGEVRWCQGYSEPGAGSDLASLQTKAVAEGDTYIINVYDSPENSSYKLKRKNLSDYTDTLVLLNDFITSLPNNRDTIIPSC